jgi:hypothetical protein
MSGSAAAFAAALLLRSPSMEKVNFVRLSGDLARNGPSEKASR